MTPGGFAFAIPCGGRFVYLPLAAAISDVVPVCAGLSDQAMRAFSEGRLTVLAPFSATLWYILAHRLVTHKRSGYRAPIHGLCGTALIVIAMPNCIIVPPMSQQKQGLRTQREKAADQKAKTALHCGSG